MVLTQAVRMGHGICAASPSPTADLSAMSRRGSHWEWEVLRSENGAFDANSYVDLVILPVIPPAVTRQVSNVLAGRPR